MGADGSHVSTFVLSRPEISGRKNQPKMNTQQQASK